MSVHGTGLLASVIKTFQQPCCKLLDSNPEHILPTIFFAIHNEEKDEQWKGKKIPSMSKVIHPS